jgi:molybdate transport system substrate-binding protein
MTTTTRWLLGAAAVSLAVVTTAACGDDGDATGDTATPDAGGPALHGSVTVFAAASLSDAFGEIAEDFADHNPGVTVELNLAGSSALREQILAGAPGDVFASADQPDMDEVIEGRAADRSEVFARNSLEIAVPPGNPAGVDGLDDFADADLLIGLCAPEVPCGELGREALAAAGVTPEPDTEEPDVRSLLTKVVEGDLDAGIVYRSDVRAAGDGVEGIVIPSDVNAVAEYPIAVLTGSEDATAARAFVDHVLGDDGRAVLESWGFEPA